MLLLVVATAVAAAPKAAAAPLRVVTTIAPLAMIVEEVGGDRVEVSCLLPAGSDPHVFEARPSDLRAVAEAGLFVHLGSEIDDWLGDETAATAATSVALDPREHAAYDDHGGDDLHVWLDPLWVRDRAVPALHRALAALDPQGAARIGAAARRFAERLTDLDDDVRASLADAPIRAFLALHPGWNSFATRYALRPLPGLAESEAREPSLKAMRDAVAAARAAGARAVLVERQHDRRLADALAAELGVAIEEVDALGDLGGPSEDRYARLMMANAAAFGRALGIEEDEDEEEGEATALPSPAVSP